MPDSQRGRVAAGSSAFLGRTTVMDSEDLRRATRRMAHEVVERNHGSEGVVVIGLQTGGVWLARLLAGIVEEVGGAPVPLGTLDVSLYRDDIGWRPMVAGAPTHIPGDITGRTVVLVDDVLFTGRTVRAALNALSDHGRARAVQLAMMVDRGHRELPIRPDFVGKNLPTRRDEMVDVTENGVQLGERVAQP
ncbi:MAG: bifunctional pyr operon transcriptional regulator/uracil phosphoribosyltransferase PyrR [Acidimicrobiales bacterium]